MNSTCSVVVADDSRDAADSLVALLGAMGYSATAAYDGREAVEACSALMPDVAILDIQMPLLDGCAAARLIRAGAHPPKMIASLSAQRHWDEPMKSEGGAFDVRLAKPARIEQLRELLALAIGRGSGDSTCDAGAAAPDGAQAIAAPASACEAATGPAAGTRRDPLR
jgi:CheY-like chemotaxis protein